MSKDVKVVTICGSMRFASEMMRIAWDLELIKKYCVIQCVYNFFADNACINTDVFLNCIKGK